jgi:hypothetical protein
LNSGKGCKPLSGREVSTSNFETHPRLGNSYRPNHFARFSVWRVDVALHREGSATMKAPSLISLGRIQTRRRGSWPRWRSWSFPAGPRDW